MRKRLFLWFVVILLTALASMYSMPVIIKVTFLLALSVLFFNLSMMNLLGRFQESTPHYWIAPLVPASFIAASTWVKPEIALFIAYSIMLSTVVADYRRAKYRLSLLSYSSGLIVVISVMIFTALSSYGLVFYGLVSSAGPIIEYLYLNQLDNYVASSKVAMVAMPVVAFSFIGLGYGVLIPLPVLSSFLKYTVSGSKRLFAVTLADMALRAVVAYGV